MTPLSKLFHKLCSKMIILLASLLIELIILIHKLKSSSRSISTHQYLKFIEKTNPTICYTKRLSKAEQGGAAECRVCLCELEEGEKVRKLQCHHMFHRDCLDKWLQQYWATCPLCRKQVVPNDVVFKHRQHQNQAAEGFDGNNDDHLPYFLSAFRRGNTLHRYF
ncbi:unnamed protein product [Sphenostylis stenocarpa]|uniref:RING-type domain-containing protein n=1 Tax=Sphenostylis stenocarpa TaxID=92480 RepID=A0AA86V6E0_9FABA|nr:unnamed protein product [Sphenostylis stenocarpa]